MLFEIIAAVVFPPYAVYRLLDWVIGNGTPKLNTKREIQKPTSEANCVFPVVWGTVDIKSPVLGWCGDFSVSGLHYHATAVFHLCHGIIDELLSISWDSKIASNLELLSEEYPGYYLQYNPDLFGSGDGVSGRFLYYKGNKTDAVNAYVDSIDNSLTQAYRGLASVVMENNYMGNSPALHNPSFRVCRYFRDTPNGSNPFFINSSRFVDFDDYVVTNETELMVTTSDTWSFEQIGLHTYYKRDVAITTLTNLRMTLDCYDPTGSINKECQINATPTGATSGKVRIWPIYNNTGGWENYERCVNSPVNAGLLSIGNYIIEIVLRRAGFNSATVQAGGSIEVTGAFVIKDIISNLEYGCKVTSPEVDTASFVQASQTLAAEKFGLSTMWEGDQKREDFVIDILSHIDGRLVEDRNTGKLKLKLIRKLEETSSLFTINRTNCVSVKNPSKPELYESANCVTVNYYDLGKRSNESVTVENQVLIEANGGRRIELNYDFSAISRKDLAQRVALRELNAIVAQPFSCTLECDSTCMFLEQGDAFNLDWPDYLNKVTTMRVGEMDFGDGTTNRVIIQAVQDVFALPALSLSGKA